MSTRQRPSRQGTNGVPNFCSRTDQLDRLSESKDGHGDVAGDEYDLANEQTKITYPSGKSVVRAFDKAGRLESVTDWLEHTTKFAYDADSGDYTQTLADLRERALLEEFRCGR